MSGRQSGDSGRILWGVYFNRHTELLCRKVSLIKAFLNDRKYNFIRSGERNEFYWAKEHTTLNKFNFDRLEDAIRECKGYPVYFTIDLDVLDPSIFPGTGTPEAGGVTFLELLSAIIKVSELNIVGMDVNELAPNLDTSGVSTAVACKIIRELLLSIRKN